MRSRAFDLDGGGVAPGPQKGSRVLLREFSAPNDLAAVHEDVFDPDGVGVETRGAGGQIRLGIDGRRSDGVRVEDRDIRTPVLGETPAFAQTSPWCVSAINTPRSIFTIRLLC